MKLRAKIPACPAGRKNQRLKIKILLFTLCFLYLPFCVAAQDRHSSQYVSKAWALQGKKQFEELYKIIDECISKFSTEAERLAKPLRNFPSKGDEKNFSVMNDVATCYFIKAESLRSEKKIKDAENNFQIIIDKYPYAQAFDPRGWYWSLKEKAELAIIKIKNQGCLPIPVDTPDQEIKVKLYDSGSEFPVNYAKYGKFKGRGTKDYKYVINDPIGLAKATGEGIYPNTTSLKFDPEYVRLKKKLFKINHWEILNSRDFNTAFYKWNVAPEASAVKQFNIAEILEKSGYIKQAIKAYHAILVHYPQSYGWTYWHTPWYVGKAAIYRIQYLLKNNPDLGFRLKNASIQLINGYDNNVRNDIFVVNPGELVKIPFWKRNFSKNMRCNLKRMKFRKIVYSRGEKIKLVKYNTGDWQMLINNKPFILKAITYSPSRVGESPDNSTLENWTTQDTNDNGIIDAPYESWVDKNRNNVQDPDEKKVGDFQLMKQMGVNSLRLYHQPFELNKKILGQMHRKYGIYILLGDFLGKYTLGSQADWETGTDYDNPEHQENMLKSIKKMVLEFRDEPYVLIWLLGNENVYGLGCNADKKPASFFKFANKAALLIKSLDPQKRPVAIVSGDTLFLDVFAKNCPDIDIYGLNAYRGRYGFSDVWDEVKRTADKPVIITEYGAPSYGMGYTNKEREQYQADYHKACWLNIECNSAGFGAGNSLGGIAFEWLDEWWKAYEPDCHDWHRLSAGPFLDGYFYEEWFGICGQGQGKNSPFLRQLKKSYYTYKELWN